MIGIWQLSPSAASDESIPKECPAVDIAEKTVHIAHESDCTKFYKCNSGKKVLMQCPALPDNDQLHFNPKLQVCDYPDQAGCILNPEIPPHTPAPPDGSTIPHRPTELPKTCTTNIIGIFFPHETHCYLFYECIYGDLIRRTCREGLHFDKIRQTCVQPWETNCKESSQDPPLTTPETIVTESSTAGTPAMDMNEIQDLCPTGGSDHCPFYPHECHCEKYYACADGRLVLQQCKHGWHFNPHHLICDRPENAGCDGSTPPTRPPPSTKPPPRCGPWDDHTWAHPKYCELYYQCENEREIIKECPQGKHYDHELGYCDWAENVNCEPHCPCCEHANGIETLDSVRDAMIGECPEDYDTQIPHELYWQLYYTCRRGHKTIMECSEGYAFNAALKKCELSKSRKCYKIVNTI